MHYLKVRKGLSSHTHRILRVGNLRADIFLDVGDISRSWCAKRLCIVVIRFFYGAFEEFIMLYNQSIQICFQRSFNQKGF